MRLERILRGVAGCFVLLSVLLSQMHNEYWLIFTAFVGINLFQSAFSNRCPLKFVLQKLGFKSCEQQVAEAGRV